MFFLIFTSIGLSYGIYYCLSDSIDIKYIKKKWKNLNSMMATKYDSQAMIKIMSFYMILKFFYLQITQSLCNNVVKLDKNTYEVSYVINGRLYKMIVRPERGPVEYVEILNERNENIIDHRCYGRVDSSWRCFSY